MFHVNESDVSWEMPGQYQGVVPSQVPEAAARGVRRKLLGNPELGPFLSVVEMPPDHYVTPHSHSEPEVMYILAGSATVAGQEGRAGSMVAIERDMQYDVKVGSEGVRFLLFRTKPAAYQDAGTTGGS